MRRRLLIGWGAVALSAMAVLSPAWAEDDEDSGDDGSQADAGSVAGTDSGPPSGVGEPPAGVGDPPSGVGSPPSELGSLSGLGSPPGLGR